MMQQQLNNSPQFNIAGNTSFNTTNNTTNNVNIQINNKTITTITPKHNKNETKIEKLNKHLQFFMIDI